MNDRGFTLIEVLVALAITALVALITYSALSAVVVANDSTGQDAQRLQAVDQLFQLLQRDISQAVRRPVSNEYGEQQPALSGNNAAGELLVLTRAGWPNSRKQMRSDLQRVRYRWDGTSLWREYWQHTDRVIGEEAIASTIASGIQGIRLRFLGTDAASGSQESAQWRDSWLMQDSTGQFPLAIEVVAQLQAWGEVRRVFLLPANG
jgi:general secretion pathway protein J